VSQPTITPLEALGLPHDNVARAILAAFHPVMLQDFVTINTGRDGNCMYHTLSLGLYSTEKKHLMIRLLAALEMALHHEYYDTTHPNYNDLMKDCYIVTDCYIGLLKSSCTPGCYSEMLHLY